MRRCLLPGLLILALAGCGRSGGSALKTEYQGQVIAEPPPGMVRIVGVAAPADPKTAHWKWSLRGDRVWNRASVETTENGRIIRLGGAYPLDSREQTGGSGAWNIDLGIIAIDPDEVSMGVKFMLGVHPVPLTRSAGDFTSQTGPNASVNQTGNITGAAKAADASTLIKPQIQDEQTLKLPAEVPLVRIEWADPDGAKQAHTITLKIEE